MERVSIFSTVSYQHPDVPNKKISKIERFFQTCENYFYWGGEKDYVIPHKKIGKSLETERRGPIKRQTKRETIYRILSYSTVLVPLILGVGKLLHRFRRRFARFQAAHILFSFRKAKNEVLGKKKMLIQEAKGKDSIENGYGEYIAYQLLPSGERTIPSDSLFQQTQSVLQLFNESAQRPTDGNLFSLLKEQLQQIDPSLSVAFVPKSLYSYIESQKQSRSSDNLDTRVHNFFLQHLKRNTFSYEDLKNIIQQETPTLCQQRLLDVTALESTSFAASHRFIYRANGQLGKDRPYFLGKVRSLAYTTFLTCDSKEQEKGYLIPVVYRDLDESPFLFLPQSSLVTSRIWHVSDTEMVTTSDSFEQQAKDLHPNYRLLCDAETFFTIFNKYRDKAIPV